MPDGAVRGRWALRGGGGLAAVAGGMHSRIGLRQLARHRPSRPACCIRARCCPCLWPRAPSRWRPLSRRPRDCRAEFPGDADRPTRARAIQPRADWQGVVGYHRTRRHFDLLLELRRLHFGGRPSQRGVQFGDSWPLSFWRARGWLRMARSRSERRLSQQRVGLFAGIRAGSGEMRALRDGRQTDDYMAVADHDLGDAEAGH